MTVEAEYHKIQLLFLHLRVNPIKTYTITCPQTNAIIHHQGKKLGARFDSQVNEDNYCPLS